MRDNPYKDDGIGRERATFFGPTDTLCKIYKECSKKPPVSVSLQGTRKSGKTTILGYLQSPEIQKNLKFHELLKRHIFVYLDMEYGPGNTAEDFFRKASECILQKLPPDCQVQVAINQVTGNPSNNEQHLRTILSELYKQKYYTILLIDGFDKFAEEIPVSPSFFDTLRSFATQGKVGYVTASTRQLHIIVPKSTSSPFFDGFTHVPVGPLEGNEADALITASSIDSGQSFRQDEVTWIRKQGGRNAFFLQRICHHFHEQKQQLNGQMIDRSKMRQDIYNDLKPCFQAIWQDLSLDKQRQFYQDREQPAKAKRKIPELSESDLFFSYVSNEHKKR